MKRFLAIGALVVGFAGVAHATNLYTPPFWGGGAVGDFVNCKLANVSTAPKTVRLQLVDGNGTVLQDSGNVVLGAGNIGLVNSGGAVGNNVVCHFTAPSKGSVRGSGTFTDASNPSSNDTFIVPAQ